MIKIFDEMFQHTCMPKRDTIPIRQVNIIENNMKDSSWNYVLILEFIN